MKRTWTIVAVIVAAVLGAWWMTWANSPSVAVQTAAAARESIREFVDERGKTRLPQTHLITMPFAGRVEAIDLAEGAPVRKGQVVARLVPLDLELAVQQARAAVQRLEASVRENADVSVEETGYKQTLQFVQSMKATVDAAEARMRSGRAKFDYAEKNLGRIQRLAESGGAASQDELDRAILQKIASTVDYQQDQLIHAAMVAMQAATNLMPTMVRQYIDRKSLTENVLLKQKAEAEARLQQVLQEQQRGTMASPVDGVVLRREVSNERYLSAGTVLLEIGRLEDLEVEAEVLSVDVVQAKVGDPVEIYGPAIGRPHARGTVARIYPAGFTKISSLGVEQQRVLVIIRLAAEDLRRLLDRRSLGVGYRVGVRITTAEKSQALVVPRAALFRARDNQWQVYVVRDGRARIQDVQVGLMNDDRVEIAAGIDEGDEVVVAPESNLSDGVHIEAEKKSIPAAGKSDSPT